jgi:hypothetical protein
VLNLQSIIPASDKSCFPCQKKVPTLPLLSDETLANFIKRKHPKERGRKRNKGALLSAFIEHDYTTHIWVPRKKRLHNSWFGRWVLSYNNVPRWVY